MFPGTVVWRNERRFCWLHSCRLNHLSVRWGHPIKRFPNRQRDIRLKTTVACQEMASREKKSFTLERWRKSGKSDVGPRFSKYSRRPWTETKYGRSPPDTALKRSRQFQNWNHSEFPIPLISDLSVYKITLYSCGVFDDTFHTFNAYTDTRWIIYLMAEIRELSSP